MPASFLVLDRDPAFLLPLQLDRSKTILGQVSYQGLALCTVIPLRPASQ
jgi:hypothetical protein